MDTLSLDTPLTTSQPYAFSTLVTSDSYLPGALALAAALKDVHPQPPVHPEVSYQTICLVTPETVNINTIKLLRRAFDVVIGVEVIEEENAAGLNLLGRPDLTTVLTKLHVFRLTQYKKLIFLDADVLPLRPLSHLFNLPHEFSAAPDVGWPDIFNSGVMVLTPGEDKFNELITLVKSKGSWDGGDQGVLNEWRGNDWHRLSFTYNTTPTAAYTYAPAYERFGAQISAVHFIGPNKPWSELPYRAPGSQASRVELSDLLNTSLSETQPAPKQSYAYGALVDRWFDVYDRHYRSINVDTMEQREFQVQRYESAWNESGSTGSIQTSSSSGILDLDDLRKAAIEGVYGARMEYPRTGEGEYRSLPLEGRIDLMRPKREPKTSEPEHQRQHHHEENLASETISVAHQDSGRRWEDNNTRMGFLHFDQDNSFRMDTLLTPGPDEIPPAPRLPPLSVIPPTPPVINIGSQNEQQNWERHMDQSGGISQNYDEKTHQYQQQNPPSESNQTSHWQPPQSHQPQYREYQRPPSPPLLTWNPAIEPPPNNPPPPTAFRADSFFPNAWDVPPNTAQFHAAVTGTPIPDSSSFFDPPPQGEIPRHLLQEGHYSNVTGHVHHYTEGGGGQPTPDRSKVTTVFPWENRPRHTPGRKFPESDQPPPGVPYIEDTPSLSEGISESKSDSISEVVSQASQDTLHIQTSPPKNTVGYTGSRSFSNAWDSIVGIQRYAQRLTAPIPTSVVIPPPTPRHRRRSASSRSWDERADANSMDGDVEDEGDDDDNDDVDDVKWADNGQDEKPRNKSKNGSSRDRASSDVGPRSSSSSRNKYKSLGVQTLPRAEKEFGVQVDLCHKEVGVEMNSASVQKDDLKPSSRKMSDSHIDLPAPTTVQEFKLGSEQIAGVTPSIVPMHSFIKPPRHSAPTGTISPRLHDPHGDDSPRTYSPLVPSTPAAAPLATSLSTTTITKLPPTTTQALRIVAPVVTTRTVSNETATSPASTGPVSPPDLPIMSRERRKSSGRSWNPATGVDVFKRGSEEVLARFLRMGAWDEDNHSHSHSHSHSQTTIS